MRKTATDLIRFCSNTRRYDVIAVAAAFALLLMLNHDAGQVSSRPNGAWQARGLQYYCHGV